ncbi:MAG: ABC transporter permease [Prevotellaceae bacterium]|jgi:ABC-type antimicrobial peptide transport system permease subunit|nr:ABC transporter permease [Prevotellaceae bacterium]
MFLKQTFRITLRNKTYSILNILGLAIGITAATLIFLWVEYHFGYNKSIPKSENLYITGQHQIYDGKVSTFLVAPGPLSKTLDEKIPEIKCNARYSAGNHVTFIWQEQNKALAESGWYADSTLVGMIDLEFVKGDPETAFDGSDPIIISQKMADRFFGDEEPIGKSLKGDFDRSYQVTGVFKDIEKNTAYRFDWLIPFSIMAKEYVAKGWVSEGAWSSNWMQMIIEVEHKDNVDAINQKLKTLMADVTNGQHSTEMFIYPQNKLRLYYEFADGKPTGGGYIRTVRMFMYIGFVILLIACINFMNLSTARSEKRAMEVGVRKSFGARQSSLMLQFTGESAITTFAALLLSVALSWLCLPAFNQLVSLRLSLSLSNINHLAGLLAIGIICSLLAGLYPAFFLSSFSPLKTLKKLKVSTGISVVWIRKGLVIFQFAIAFILICATTVIFLQIRHTQNRDIGMSKENVMTFEVTDEVKSGYMAVDTELKATGFVEAAGLSDQSLLFVGSNGGGFNWRAKPEDVSPLIYFVYTSSGLIDAAGLKLIEGRDFSTLPGSGRQALINRTLADIMGDEGKVGGMLWQGSSSEYAYEIIGIVENFVFNDAYEEKPAPLLIRIGPSIAGYLFVRIKPDVKAPEAVAAIKSKLNLFSPNETFEPIFMADRFDNMFSGKRQEGKLAFLFAAFAIFISCLGLFGLSAFSAEQRAKEIGIRKVLGASVSGIIVQLARSFMLLVFIAILIGFPVAWYVTSGYLSDYGYRISLSWLIFAGVAISVCIVAILTVCGQSYRAATTDPIKAIKIE